MNLDDLKSTWQAEEPQIRINNVAMRAVLHGRAESALRWLTPFLAGALVVDFLTLLLTGYLIGRYWDEPKYLLPTLTLHASGVAMLIASIHQWMAFRAIDYAAPVLEIQKKIEHLRVLRMQTTKWILAGAPLLWTPLAIVLLHVLFGWDAYTAPLWLAANLLFGFACIPLMLWIARRFVLDGAVERLERAKAFLAELEEWNAGVSAG